MFPMNPQMEIEVSMIPSVINPNQSSSVIPSSDEDPLRIDSEGSGVVSLASKPEFVWLSISIAILKKYHVYLSHYVFLSHMSCFKLVIKFESKTQVLCRRRCFKNRMCQKYLNKCLRCFKYSTNVMIYHVL